MIISKTLIAAAAALASLGANALTVSESPVSGNFLALAKTGDHTGTLGGTFGTIAGGQILNSDSPTADINAFGTTLFGGNFLSAGPTSTSPSVLTFTGGASFISFLWGSPDTYNTLTVTTTLGVSTYVPGGVGGLTFTTTNGSQSYAQYVSFAGTGTEKILSLTFASPSQDAFEAGNFSVTAVPEPETYALMLAGLGVLGFVARRRKPV